MYTSKGTKNVITKEQIAEELRKKDRKSVGHNVIAAVFVSIFSAIFLLLFHTLAVPSIGIPVLRIIFAIFITVLFSLPTLFLLKMAWVAHRDARSITADKLHIITDEVVYKEIQRISKRGHAEKCVIHFLRCGDVTVGRTTYQLASEGDQFYMVLRHPDSRYPLKYYSAKMYEIQDR